MGDSISIHQPTESAAWRGPAYKVFARALDLALAVIGLLVLLPVLLLLAPAVSASTRSWPLFRQVRLGKDGKPFCLTKLRTMPRVAPAQLPRQLTEHLATPLGRILRKYKLDEIPQLWDVIKGKMSLVGPRPIILEEYSKQSHHLRLAVKPGVTGLWQISPSRDLTFDESPEYDLFYIAHRSLGFDVWVIWRTLVFVLFGRETSFDRAAGWEKKTPAKTASTSMLGDPAAESFPWNGHSGNGKGNGRVAAASSPAYSPNPDQIPTGRLAAESTADNATAAGKKQR